MKIKIIITSQNKDLIFKGNPLNLPIKYLDIKKKSVELFDDEEPCIIHQSYAIQKLIDAFMTQFKGVDVNELGFMDSIKGYDFIDIENIKNMYLTIKR